MRPHVWTPEERKVVADLGELGSSLGVWAAICIEEGADLDKVKAELAFALGLIPAPPVSALRRFGRFLWRPLYCVADLPVMLFTLGKIATWSPVSVFFAGLAGFMVTSWIGRRLGLKA